MPPLILWSVPWAVNSWQKIRAAESSGKITTSRWKVFDISAERKTDWTVDCCSKTIHVSNYPKSHNQQSSGGKGTIQNNQSTSLIKIEKYQKTMNKLNLHLLRLILTPMISAVCISPEQNDTTLDISSLLHTFQVMTRIISKHHSFQMNFKKIYFYFPRLSGWLRQESPAGVWRRAGLCQSFSLCSFCGGNQWAFHGLHLWYVLQVR